MLAIKKNDLKVVIMILSSEHCLKGVLKKSDNYGRTALMLAIEKDNLKIVNLLSPPQNHSKTMTELVRKISMFAQKTNENKEFKQAHQPIHDVFYL